MGHTDQIDLRQVDSAGLHAHFLSYDLSYDS